jgi:PEP-CTERM motif-containing protein
MKSIVAVLVGLFLLLVGACPASASSITYSFAGTGTGDLNGVAFTSVSFTITVLGDTSNIVSCGVPITFCNGANSATIAIMGFSTSAFVTATQVFDNQGTTSAGFERAFIGLDLLDLRDPAFTTYNLATSFGPIFVANPFAVNQFNCNDGCVVTTQGILNFSSIVNVTFNATATPEPSTLTMFGSGIIGLAGVLRRKINL